jgi:hypothetical protein
MGVSSKEQDGGIDTVDVGIVSVAASGREARSEIAY